VPARDHLHPTVRRALERAGWVVTDDPLVLKVGRRNMFVDLGAEQLITATRGAIRIAVEVKSFNGPSELTELESALGQFVIYEKALRRQESERTLWLAIPSHIWSGLFREAIGEMLLEDQSLRLLVIDAEKETIERWIPWTPGETSSSGS